MTHAPDFEGVKWDRKGETSYGGYLGLDAVLNAQRPVSGEHDELLFIIIHQAMELWMKLCLHELGAAREQIKRDELEPAFKMMSRVARIQTQMIQSWEILATMTPADYSSFRDKLGSSSGFQSYQYRALEYALGAKNAAFNQLHEETPAVHAELTRALQAPSIYDETLRLLARRGFAVPKDHVERDWTQPYEASPEVEAVWLQIYRGAAEDESLWDLYELGEKLVDVEYRFQQWRFAHMKTVERIIGYKRGTGGSAGVSYLTKVLEKSFFPELLSLRTSI